MLLSYGFLLLTLIAFWCAIRKRRFPFAKIDASEAVVSAARVAQPAQAVLHGSAAAAPAIDPGSRTAPDPPEPQHRRSVPWLRSWTMTAALAALAVIGIVIGLTLTGPPSPVSYSFAAHQDNDGLLIMRSWTLSGSSGSELTESLSISNGTGEPVRAAIVEPVPAEIAVSLRSVKFSPVPASTVEGGRAAEWELSWKPGATITLRYSVKVDALGLNRERLVHWASDLNALLAPAPKLRSLMISPRSITIPVRGKFRLRLTGTLPNRQDAPAADLAAVRWSSANRRIAAVRANGIVVGRTAGHTIVTARMPSGLRALVFVRVTGHAGPVVTPSYGEPSQHPTAGSSTSSHSGPTPTVSSSPFAWSVAPDVSVRLLSSRRPARASIPVLNSVRQLPADGPAIRAAARIARIRGVAFSRDSKYVAVADNNGRTYVSSVPSYKHHVTLRDPASRGVTSVEFSPDNGVLATGDANGHVYLWMHAHYTKLTNPASKGVNAVAFTPNSQYLAAADANGRTRIWSLSTNTIVATLSDPASKGVRSADFSFDSKYLATGDRNGRTYVWATPADTISATLRDPGSRGVNSVAFSPNDNILATGDGNDHIYLWSHAHYRRLTDPASKGVTAVAITPNSRYLAAADANGNVYIWSLAKSRIIAIVPDPRHKAVSAVAFTPNGKYLAYGDTAGKAYLANLTKVGA
jgi:WD40 repeat protein